MQPEAGPEKNLPAKWYNVAADLGTLLRGTEHLLAQPLSTL